LRFPVWLGRRRPPVRWRAPQEPSQWQTLEWRAGTNFTLRSRFARVRVHAAHRDHKRTQMRPEQWVLIEWPEGHREPMKYWLSTLPEDVPLQRMVFEAKMRWRIERDYQDLKQELGLGHYEGRGWRGFHHHASLSIAAYGFLMAPPLRPALPMFLILASYRWLSSCFSVCERKRSSSTRSITSRRL
jgi:SRSO17 transposase